MGKIMEPAFMIVCLVVVLTLGGVMIAQSKGNPARRLWGVMAIVLGGGDAFHLVPRVFGRLTDTLADLTAPLGIGTLITSITMTVFYVMLYEFWRGRYRKQKSVALSVVVYGLAIARIALCLFPQNAWMSASAPLRWGIYRNIPFALIGAIIVMIFYREATVKGDRPYRFAYLAVLLSFLFYLPVVIWADAVPAVGMLMIPKTICYVWLVWMGYAGSRTKKEA